MKRKTIHIDAKKEEIIKQWKVANYFDDLTDEELEMFTAYQWVVMKTNFICLGYIFLAMFGIIKIR